MAQIIRFPIGGREGIQVKQEVREIASALLSALIAEYPSHQPLIQQPQPQPQPAPAPKRKVIYERAKETAVKIRKAMKKEFPGTKFSVRTAEFSMGNSVDVDWTDGPTSREVDTILDRFKSGSFDGMTDSYEYSAYEYEGKFYSGAKYVSGQRRLSPEYRRHLEDLAAAKFGDYNKDDHRYFRWINEVEVLLKSNITSVSG